MLDLSMCQASGTRMGSLLEGQGEPGMGQTLDRRPAGEGHLPRLPWMSVGGGMSPVERRSRSP